MAATAAPAGAAAAASAASSNQTLPPILALLEDRAHSQIIKQGAEAKVYCVREGIPSRPTHITTLAQAGATADSAADAAAATNAAPQRVLLKYRFPKTYRHPILSAAITARRTAMEARSLLRCARAGVHVPAIRAVDDRAGVLGLEWVDGRSVREWLGGGAEGEDEVEGDAEAGEGQEGPEEEEEPELTLSEEDQLKVMEMIGAQIAHMHSIQIVHGDLTTSNIMLRPLAPQAPSDTKGKAKATAGTAASVDALTSAFLTLSTSDAPQRAEVVLIDFGLSSVSHLAEDKAVDLYVLERAFASTHPASGHLFARILDTYFAELARRTRGEKVAKGALGTAAETKRKLEEVRLRGRKRSMVG